MPRIGPEDTPDPVEDSGDTDTDDSDTDTTDEAKITGKEETTISPPSTAGAEKDSGTVDEAEPDSSSADKGTSPVDETEESGGASGGVSGGNGGSAGGGVGGGASAGIDSGGRSGGSSGPPEDTTTPSPTSPAGTEPTPDPPDQTDEDTSSTQPESTSDPDVPEEVPKNLGPQSGPATDPEAHEELQEDLEMTEDREQTIEEATDEGGLLSEEQEENLQESSRSAYETLDISTGVRETLVDAGVPEAAAGFTAGVSKLPAEFTSAVPGVINLGEQGVEASQSVVTGETDPVDISQAVASSGAEVTGSMIGEFRQNPAEASGTLAAELVVSAGALKGLEKAGDITRASRLRMKSDDTVKLEDITTEPGTKGELPKFDTDPDAPTQQAVREIEERAADNPDVIAPGESETSIFHTTQGDIPGDLDVGEGASELPGMFGSPEASPIGLTMPSKSTLPDIELRGPRLRGEGDQVVSLPGDDVRGMPDEATGAGYELRTPEGDVETRGLGRGEAKAVAEGTDLEVKPQSDTPGYEFLSEQAEEGAAYVRPRGSRSTELEAIYPPGSEFVEEGVTAVNIGRKQIPGTDIDIPGTGRTVPGRRFRRTDSDTDVDTGTLDIDDSGSGSGPADVTEIPTSQLTSRDGVPVGPPAGVPGSSGSSGTPSGTETGLPGAGGESTPGTSDIDELGSSTPPSDTSPTAPPSSGMGKPSGESTGPPSDVSGSPSGGSGKPTGSPTSPPPSSPPSSPPPSSPPSSPPPSAPPSSPPGSPTGTPTGGSGTPTGDSGTPTNPPSDIPDLSVNGEKEEKEQPAWYFTNELTDTGIASIEEIKELEMDLEPPDGGL